MIYTCNACDYQVTFPPETNQWQCPNCGLPNLSNPVFSLDGKARTQKGIGIGVLKSIYPNSTLNLLQIAQEEKDLAGVGFPCFARPAPSSPKHGYIDSRVVKDKEEAAALLKEVLADDPKGELLLCGFLEATHNAIWTPGSLVIGRGHDGATAGKSTVTVPLCGEMPKGFTAEVLKKAKIGVGEWPYVEVVLAGASSSTYNAPSGVVLTQLRAGPEIKVKGDYIPKKVEVQKVLTADASKFKDRDWELLIDKAAGEPGVVVWHPGGAMTDHFSIHAFTHGIPILFGEKPSVGDVLEPIKGHEAVFDARDMLRGVMAGDKFKLHTTTKGKARANVSPAVSAMLLALHNATACTGEGSRWVGFAAAIMLRLGVTALAGEARHLGIGKGPKGSRDQVYTRVINFPLARQRTRVGDLTNMFRYGQWPSSGFGGAKWANCGGATVMLFEAVRRLAVEQTPDTAAAVVRALNLAVNQAHNGGWWMNKFVSTTAFDAIQKADIPWMLHPTAQLYVAGKICESISPEKLNAFITKVAKWPRTTLKPPKVESVQMTYQPGIAAVGLKISSRLLGSLGRVISAPVTTELGLMDSFLKDHTFIVSTDDGYRVEVRPPGKDPLVIWEDESLEKSAIKAVNQ